MNRLSLCTLVASLLVVSVGCGGGDDDNPDGATSDAPIGPDAAVADARPVDDASPPDAMPFVCAVTQPKPTRGAPVAMSPDEKTLLVANRDVGTVTVARVDYSSGMPAITLVAELAVGGEPWQVAIDGCGLKGYVILRKDQQLVEITDLDTTPVVGRMVATGSEPTGLAITPNGTRLYVANWVDGTVSVVDPVSMITTATIDLNATLAGTGLLGTVAPRPALAHPRSIAITNNGDASDADESVYVTEYFAQRTAPEAADGTTSDVNREGLIYKVDAAGGATVVPLPPVVDTGFNDSRNIVTGCYPNQAQSITIDNGFAYVSSICASPEGPLGVFQKAACTTNAQCALPNTCSAGGCTGACITDADCGFGSPAGTCNVALGGTCKPIPTNVKTTTHPAVSIVDLAAGTATTTVLDKLFVDRYAMGGVPATAQRLPLVVEDISFVNTFGYMVANGTDALFRFTVAGGTITAVGAAAGQDFIDLAASATARGPIGLATGSMGFGFVASDITRNVTAVAFNAQALVSTATSTLLTTPLPAPGSPGDSVLRGKRFFNTGLGRWSLQGQGWGSCQSCHIDGLSDNVTWYFARGPRQSTSLDGSFASADPSDQRIFNWTAIFDEVADFEGNVRGVSGGVGALVSTVSMPPSNTDRINLGDTALFAPAGANGLAGAAGDAVAISAVADWNDITAYVRTIRSPRHPSNLNPADVAAGKALFSGVGQGNCVGCHSGAKWTISKVFYTPSGTTNESLKSTVWNVNLNGFPAALFPATTALNQVMRFGGANPTGLDALQCALRPMGTFGNSVAAVSVAELRQDMVTPAQGNATDGKGYNPPSLLGASVGAPYFHAGNARNLEEVLAAQFSGHFQSAVAQIFTPTPAQISQIVAYLLSLDEDEMPFAIPAKGATGGDLCFFP